ncbi:ribonuclease H family protein [Thermanaerothrix sp. 4228-RoL]|jgi:ribonuclease HI|uniref:Ribonuclease H n=1 Tax=Thermanaerothrix solaris TaxID=3058434 RepID=A0ABU3NLY3_9CHLR|nr:ribonuclease H family protein [Thermanaerothrix sp. 4228-RoL]MDT8897834.1 ribonuclease H family protein [Thermanaerothrix sp. 4228-RoL]
MGKSPKYYAVWRGRRPGVFDSWEACRKQVDGFPGAQYLGFETREAAEQALQRPYHEVLAERQPQPLQPHTKPTQGYCVDAAYDTAHRRLEYRCVQLPTRREIFRVGPLPDGSNNIGEFLAIVETLMLLKERGDAAPVYSDSRIALLWVTLKRCRTRIPPRPEYTALFERIRRAEHWLQNNAFVNPLLKWETALWGENPADFGRK